MRTNINLALQLAKEKPKLFGHTYSKGDIVTYMDYDTNQLATGVYLSHQSLSLTSRYYRIKIIRADGVEDTTDWIRPAANQ